jgi:hypothetical protein
MNNNTANIDSFSIRRASLSGYLITLVGLTFVIDYGWRALSSGVTLVTVAGMIVGLSAIAGGILNHLKSDELPNGAEPAPPYLYALASIATIAFAFWVFFLYSSI